MTPFVSVIIPCRNEECYIQKCLDSLLATTYPQEFLEILIVDGMSEDKTRELVAEYLKNYSFIRILDNPKKITPAAMNLGIQASLGEYIIRIDAHTQYPADYFKLLIAASIRLKADNVGGIWITDTIQKTRTATAIKNVLSDRFGVGNSLFRTGVSAITQTDTVPFGCFHRDTFKKYGLFDERLIRNQDIEFNKRIIRSGGKIFLIPDVVCTYYARETFYKLAKNNYQNGYWNILTPYYTKTLHSLNLRHFIPLFFILSLVSTILLSLWYPYSLSITALVTISYLILIGWRSLIIKKEATWLHQIWAFILLHFSYGFGSIGGIIALTKKILFRDSK